MKLSLTLTLTSIWSMTTNTNAFSPSSMNSRRHQNKHSHPFYNTISQSPSNNNDDIALLALYAAKVGLFFGTSTGSTENVADLIASELGDDCPDGPIDIEALEESLADAFGKYDALIVGTPTWNTGADSERSGTGWDEIYYGEMQDLKLDGKTVAVFGLGDQVSYAENYADATGELHDVFQDLGCKMIGYTSQEGYEHEASKSIRGDQFCGLLCDAVNQEELTEERVQNWVEQLKSEGILDGSGAGGSTVSAPAAPAPVVEVATASSSASTDSDAQAAIAKLEEENARLKKMLEANSSVLDQVLKSQVSEGFVPHYNAKTKVTMWTSHDGRQCYYTSDAPKTP